ncbi:glycosyltransferase family 2 protein [Sphingobacterium sp.]|uniref:glycosyltransferase family 2 protein n=1 Tax=Sphingobacterium sp. TaxID=341027 RepID=UPI0028AA0D7C|nr:glycosyltransferase family 2 protein [Sphingobacterium sp.]
MKVSIVTPVYNAERFIHETAKSVMGQTYKDWEWILVDDCSSDSSWEILKELASNDPRIRVYKNNENLRSGKTRNFAIGAATGRFIAFLDSDDVWHENKLSIQIPFMVENGYFFSHTSYGYLNESGEKIKSTLHVSPIVDYIHLLKRTEISCLTAIYDAEMIGKFYMSEHARKQDYALWLSILKSGVKSYGLDIELAYYRQVSNSATSKKSQLILKHVSFLRDTQGFGTVKAWYYTLYWMVNGFIRYYLR